MRLGHLIAAASIAAAAAAGAPTAAAEPAVEPPPPPPPVLTDPVQLLGPVDQLAPVYALAPQTYRMPDPQQPSPYVLTEGTPPGPFAFVDSLKGVHAMLHGALGRMPGSDLGSALPGTAPPPGTALPPGLEEFLPVPAEPALPAG